LDFGRISIHRSSTTNTFYDQLTIQFERSTRLKTEGLHATCLSFFLWIIRNKIDITSDDPQFESTNRTKDRVESHFSYGFRRKLSRHQEYFLRLREKNSGMLGDYSRRFQNYSRPAGVPYSLGMVQVLLELLTCRTRGRLRTIRGGHQDYSKPSYSTTKYSGLVVRTSLGPPRRRSSTDY
jgi:hypothetical protein